MMRQVFMQAAMGGAIVMALLTAGLLIFGWLSRPAAASSRQTAARPKRQAPARPKRQATERPKREVAARPKRPVAAQPKPKRPAKAAPKPQAAPKVKPKLQLVPVAGPGAAVAGSDVAGADQNGHSTETLDYPSWLAGTAELDADAAASAPPDSAAGHDQSAVEYDSADSDLAADQLGSGPSPSGADIEIAAPSWLGLSDPEPPAAAVSEAPAHADPEASSDPTPGPATPASPVPHPAALHSPALHSPALHSPALHSPAPGNDES